jgi:hypothetical protein
MSKGVSKHKLGKSERRAEAAERQFRKQAMALARKSLQKAVEWIDADELMWATTMVTRAAAMLEAAKRV